MAVMIGVDPHKGSHMAVAMDANEQPCGSLHVRSGPRQLEQLLGWAAGFGERVWAVESAGGLGYLLAQQLVGVGERVLDVPATLASRVRVLATTKSTPCSPLAIMLLTALPPAPPVPNTVIRGFNSRISGIFRLMLMFTSHTRKSPPGRVGPPPTDGLGIESSEALAKPSSDPCDIAATC